LLLGISSGILFTRRRHDAHGEDRRRPEPRVSRMAITKH
jgi:hypothetical protein